jgi:hypothetical protein
MKRKTLLKAMTVEDRKNSNDSVTGWYRALGRIPDLPKAFGIAGMTEKSAKPGLVIPACPESFFAVIRN